MNKDNSFLNNFKKGFKEFGEVFSITINSLILVITYILGIGITSIIAKLFNKQFLPEKSKSSKTYWQDLNLRTQPLEKYYRQF